MLDFTRLLRSTFKNVLTSRTLRKQYWKSNFTKMSTQVNSDFQCTWIKLALGAWCSFISLPDLFLLPCTSIHIFQSTPPLLNAIIHSPLQSNFSIQSSSIPLIISLHLLLATSLGPLAPFQTVHSDTTTEHLNYEVRSGLPTIKLEPRTGVPNIGTTHSLWSSVGRISTSSKSPTALLQTSTQLPCIIQKSALSYLRPLPAWKSSMLWWWTSSWSLEVGGVAGKETWSFLGWKVIFISFGLEGTFP